MATKRYEANGGIPHPRIIVMIAARSNAIGRTPPLNSITMLGNLTPMPVREMLAITVPMTPAHTAILAPVIAP